MTHSQQAALAAIMAFYTAVPAIAQSGDQADPTRKPALGVAPRLLKSDTVVGSEVRDRSNEKVGKVSDLGVETKTGKILFAVVSSGGVLGVGDTERVVSLNLRSCDTENKKCTLEMTKADLEKAPKYDAKMLEDYHRTFGGTAGIDGVKAHDAAYGKEAKERTIKGRVASVERKGSSVIAEVTEAGKTENCRIVIGPESYLKSQGIEPKVGEDIEVCVVDADPREGTPQTLVAKSVKCDKAKEAVQLRDASGRWQGDVTHGPCCALLDTIDDAKVVCGADKVGSVDDVYLDSDGGKVAFFTLTTSDFGDKATYLIPWRAVWLDTEKVAHLRPAKEQMKAAPRLSKEMTELKDPSFLRRVDEYYGGEPVTEPRHKGDMPEPKKDR